MCCQYYATNNWDYLEKVVIGIILFSKGLKQITINIVGKD